MRNTKSLELLLAALTILLIVPIIPIAPLASTLLTTPVIHILICSLTFTLTLGCLAAFVVPLVGKVLLEVLLDWPVSDKALEKGVFLLNLQNKSV